jgi:hypothetical protein
MTRTVALRFHGLLGSQAGLARSGRHMLIADRPEGLAGGQGLGFNGAEFLSAALGGCFWNDLHYAAAALGHTLSAVEVAVEITLAGAPFAGHCRNHPCPRWGRKRGASACLLRGRLSRVYHRQFHARGLPNLFRTGR